MLKSRFFVLALVVGSLSALLACGASEDAVCGTDGDCGSGRVCTGGACVLPSETSCMGDPDCAGGFVCRESICVRPESMDLAREMSNPQDMGSDPTQQDMPSDEPMDTVNPEVVLIEPADGSEDLPLDSVFKATFSEAMRATSVNFQSIVLRDSANAALAASVEYDATTKIATLTPSAPLKEATGYRLILTTFLRDEAGNTLKEEVQAGYYTTYIEPDGHRALAETFAPVIHQSMRDTSPGKINSDIPVTVNFDGNFKARDNKSKSILGVNRPSAQVYYHVVESKTHYFITYALYYPSRYDRNSDERNEHDFAGGVAVVERATNELVLFEGVKVDPGGHTAIGFKPATSEVSGTGSSFTPLESFDPADGIEDSTHYRMFVTSGIHETCSWANEGPNITPAICRHEAKEFPGGTMAGVVMRHGEAQKFSDATTNATSGFLNMNYGLVPFASSLWKRRSDVGSERIFEQVAAYEPIGSRADRPEGAERPIVLPGKMVSDDALSFGFSPATWLESTGTNNAGQWLLDPAYMLLERYNFTGDYSTDYCVNLFLGIDRRGDTMHPECT